MNKYNYEIELIKRKIKNNYITKISSDWATYIDGKKYKMNSSINVDECIFIHKLIMKSKPKRVFEFGLANGMSTMIMLNALNKVNGKVLYSNDPFQKEYWQNVGLYNVSQTKGNVKHVHVKKLSTDDFSEFETGFFDLILIDGAHDKISVTLDIVNTKRMLKVNGIMILDDVLHGKMSEAIAENIENDFNYIKICLEPQSKDDEYHEYYNPKTMSAYKKIS